MKPMRQAVMFAEKQIKLEMVNQPKLTPDGVLVRVNYCGICGTDVMNFNGDVVWGRKGYPKYPGHEISGTIVEVGSEVKNFKMGDRVTAETTIGCGNCDWCKKGIYSICNNRKHFSNGGMADYVNIPAKAVYRIPDHLGFEEAALIEPMAVGVYAARRLGDIYGQDVALIGGGPIGLGSLQTMKLMGANKLFILDTKKAKLELAKQLGATHGINVLEQDPVKIVMDETKKEGLAGIVIATRGTADILKQSVQMIRPCGAICLVGLSGGKMSEIDGDMLADKNAVLLGSHSSPGVFPELINLVASGKFMLKPVISHIFPAEDIQNAFLVFYQPDENPHKVLIRFS